MFLLQELKELEYLLQTQSELLQTHIARYGNNVTDADVTRLMTVNSALLKVRKKITRTKKKTEEYLNDR